MKRGRRQAPSSRFPPRHPRGRCIVWCPANPFFASGLAPRDRYSMNPNAEPLIGLLILLVISVAAWFSRGLRGRGPSLSGPALVLQRFDTRPRGSDALLNLVGRPEGLVGWF